MLLLMGKVAMKRSVAASIPGTGWPCGSTAWLKSQWQKTGPKTKRCAPARYVTTTLTRLFLRSQR